MQNSDCQLFSDSVENELYLDHEWTQERLKTGEALLSRMGLQEFVQHHPASLSGGQKQRLCIAVACMKDSDVICFDEPTSGLDYDSMLQVSDLLHELSLKGKVLLVTSHDYEFLMSACTHICYLKDGEVKDYYTVDENTASKTYEILFSDLSGWRRPEEGQNCRWNRWRRSYLFAVTFPCWDRRFWKAMPGKKY